MKFLALTWEQFTASDQATTFCMRLKIISAERIILENITGLVDVRYIQRNVHIGLLPDTYNWGLRMRRVCR